MSPLTNNPYTFHKYPNSANRNIKKAIKAIKILTFYQQRRTLWYHVCEKQQLGPRLTFLSCTVNFKWLFLLSVELHDVRVPLS